MIAVRIATAAAAAAVMSSGDIIGRGYWGFVAMSAWTTASTAPQNACWEAVENSGWLFRMLLIWLVVRLVYLPPVEYCTLEAPRDEYTRRCR